MIAKTREQSGHWRQTGSPAGRFRLLTAGSDLSEGIYCQRNRPHCRRTGYVGGAGVRHTQRGTAGPGVFRHCGALPHPPAGAGIGKMPAAGGNPYVVKGRDDFLSDETVRGTIGFFPLGGKSGRCCLPPRLLKAHLALPGGFGAGLFHCGSGRIRRKLMNNLNKLQLTTSRLGCCSNGWRFTMLFGRFCGKNRPRKLLERWAEKLPWEKRRIPPLLEAAVSTRKCRHFYNCSPWDRKAILHAVKGLHLRYGYPDDAARFQRAGIPSGLFLCGVQKGRIPLGIPAPPDGFGRGTAAVLCWHDACQG